jgi:hypothetical protein
MWRQRGGTTKSHKIEIGSSFRMITRRTETKYDQNQLDSGGFPSHAMMHKI